MQIEKLSRCASSLRIVAALVVVLSISLRARAQSPAPTSYDVSTVKPSAPDRTGMMLNWARAELKAENVTPAWILTSAFHARRDQISGAPGWAQDQHFDITAKLIDTDQATAETMTADQHRALLLALLVERFGLKYHVETKDLPTYDLVPAKKGLRLTAAADTGDKDKRVYGMCSGCASFGNNEVTAHDLGLASFAELLAGQLGRTVNDRTGFTGKIDIKLKWVPDLGSKPASEEDAALPPLPHALEEEMGLRLVPSRGPVKLYVIDRLEKPSDN